MLSDWKQFKGEWQQKQQNQQKNTWVAAGTNFEEKLNWFGSLTDKGSQGPWQYSMCIWKI